MENHAYALYKYIYSMCCNRNRKEPHRAFYCASICSLYIFGDLYEMPISFKQLKNLCQLHILHSSHSQLFIIFFS